MNFLFRSLPLLHGGIIGAALALCSTDVSRAGMDPMLAPQTKIAASGGQSGDQFGARVAISGNTAVVGANKATVDGKAAQGAVYIFVRGDRSEEHTSELQSRQYLHSFPTRRSSDLLSAQPM